MIRVDIKPRQDDRYDILDISDYERMCVSCHRRYDADRRERTGARTSPVRR